MFRFRLGLWDQWASGFPVVIAKFLALRHLDPLGNISQIPLHRHDLLTDLSRRAICFELCPSTYIQTGTFSSLAPVRDVIRRLDDADVPYCSTTDNPGFNSRYLQAEYEMALDYDLLTSRG